MNRGDLEDWLIEHDIPFSRTLSVVQLKRLKHSKIGRLKGSMSQSAGEQLPQGPDNNANSVSVPDDGQGGAGDPSRTSASGTSECASGARGCGRSSAPSSGV